MDELTILQGAVWLLLAAFSLLASVSVTFAVRLTALERAQQGGAE